MLFPNICVIALIAVSLASKSFLCAEENKAPDSPMQAVAEASNSIATPEIVNLKFEDFFKMPVGPYGLEVTDKIKSLDGKKVRLCGFMVHEECCTHPGQPAHSHDDDSDEVKGRFLLSPIPVTVNYDHYGLCDDLPPQTLYVSVPELSSVKIPFLRLAMEVVGTLHVGIHEEQDGRQAVVSLAMDSSPQISELIALSNRAKAEKQPLP